MIHYTDITGLAGVAIAVAAAPLLIPGIAKLSRSRFALLLGTVFVLALLPFGELPLAAYLRGATGDLSITTLVLLGCTLRSKLRASNSTVHAEPVQAHALLTLIAITAVVFYPLALGLWMFDPYRLGYGDPLFLAALLLIALAAWLTKSTLLALCLALAALAWSISWYESSNLWDYLLDPFVSIYALGSIAFFALKNPRTRAQRR